MPPHDTEDDRTLVRRVSFSNMVHYSDDASSTTATTDDELYQDDGSLTSGNDDQGSVGNELRESGTEGVDDASVEETDAVDETDADAKDEIESIKEDTEEAKYAMVDDDDDDDDDARKESNNQTKVTSESSYKQWGALDDEPPLVIRDVGVYERPSEYLGGYEPELSACSSHRVKLRKSWLADADGEEVRGEAPYDQFEAWKKSRVIKEPSFKKKKQTGDIKPMEHIVTNSDTAPRSEDQEDEDSQSKQRSTEMSEGEQIPTGKKANTEEHGDGIPLEKFPQSKTVQADKKTKDKPILRKTEDNNISAAKSAEPALKKKARPTVSKTSISDAKAHVPPPATKHPKKKDPETETFEKEILELKKRITKLRRTQDVIEVRTISQLADLEEDTTKRMREYRSKANDIARKKRATEEKQSLKEKAMKSQDLIEHFRRSNQTLRAEGIKMKKAVEELKKSNRLLQEKNSVHLDYVAQFRRFQEVEVRLAEDMNKVLNTETPKYEKLTRGMEEGVKAREKSLQSERKAKDLYVECMHSIFTMVEENSTDDSLIERVATIMDADSDNEAKMDRSMTEDELKRAKPIRRGKSASLPDIKMSTPQKVSKRQSDSSLDNEAPNPIKKTSRRCSTGGTQRASDAKQRGSTMKKTQQQQQQQTNLTPRRSSTTSFRSTSTPQKSLAKVVSDNDHDDGDDDDDDASTCSINSLQSGTYSLSSSVAGYFK